MNDSERARREAGRRDRGHWLGALDPSLLQIWLGLSHGRGFLPRRIKVTNRSRYWHVKIRIGAGMPADLVYEARFLNLEPSRIWTGVRVTTAAQHPPAGQDWYRVKRTFPYDALRLSAVLEGYFLAGAGYDFWSGLRFVPWIRAIVGDREGRRQRTRFNCSKLALVAFRDVGIDLIPRKVPFRCAPADFEFSERLEDPAPIEIPPLSLIV